MHDTPNTIGLLSHLSATVAYAMLALALLLRKAPTGFRLSVVLAATVTAIWAAASLSSSATGQQSPWLVQLGTLRTAAWIAVLLVLQRRSLGLPDKPTSSFVIAVSLGFVVALLFALDLGMRLTGGGEPPPSLMLLFVTGRLVLAISGVVLLHNLYVNSSDASGLNFRMFAVGLGIIFAYDLNLYTIQFLSGEPSVALRDLRGAVYTLAVPLIYLGMRSDGNGRLTLSHRAAFHTVSFTIIGAYLIGMSILSYGLRLTGGDWGALLQIAFLVVTLTAGALVVLSPRFRAELKVRIARNFYRYRYDYRVEWLGFIRKLDADAESSAPIRERLVQAIAAVLHCPGGALLEAQQAGSYGMTTHWNWEQIESFPPQEAESSFVRFLATTGRVVQFDRLRAERQNLATGGSHGDLTLPDWASQNRSIWLAVPLIHREQLRGILLLERSIAPRDLNWEDFDLLRTLGRQSASYLAEADTMAQLEEARSFDEYNRRFAFVMHDVKNVVSQLGLLARNAERHADKPAFRADMVVTLKSSVAKMNDLLNLMGSKAQAAAPAPMEQADLARSLTLVCATLRRQHSALELTGADHPMTVPGDAGRLEAMFTHLIQNAIDASAPDAPIAVSLERDGGNAVIAIRDAGHGMSSTFIRDELFKPFRSTKEAGFGVGAFESREIARGHGGQLEVDSRPGEGTTFTVRLPLGGAAPRSPARLPGKTEKSSV